MGPLHHLPDAGAPKRTPKTSSRSIPKTNTRTPHRPQQRRHQNCTRSTTKYAGCCPPSTYQSDIRKRSESDTDHHQLGYRSSTDSTTLDATEYPTGDPTPCTANSTTERPTEDPSCPLQWAGAVAVGRKLKSWRYKPVPTENLPSSGEKPKRLKAPDLGYGTVRLVRAY